MISGGSIKTRYVEIPSQKVGCDSQTPLQFSFEGLPDDNKTPVFCKINNDSAVHFIRQYEWLGDTAPCFLSFGLYFGYHLGACVIFTTPFSYEMAKGIAGDKWAKKVIWLSRGSEAHWVKGQWASVLISKALKEMNKLGYNIVIAYADERAGEIGTVYQATNWLYTGHTKLRTDLWVDGMERNISNSGRSDWRYLNRIPLPKIRIKRPLKHRYIYIMGSHKERKEIQNNLLYPVLPYPKREF